MKIRLLIFITIFVFAWACKKKQTQTQTQTSPVPSVPVDLTVYPNDPLNFTIQAIGGWKYISGGINGIVVYRKSEQEFVAVERTSSYYPNNAAAKVKVQADNFTLKDTVSGSKWQIFDGAVISGPATWGLRLYGTTFDGTTLRIRN